MATELRDVRFRITAQDNTAQAFASIERRLSSFAKSLLPAFSAAALVAFVRQAINAADAMRDLHIKTGLAYKELAAFKLIAEQSGSSVEGVSKSVKFLSKYMVEHADKLKTIGVTSKDVNGALRQFADVIASIKDPALRSALATEILGKAGAEMIPTLIQGSAAFEKAEERTRAYAEALELVAPQADHFNDTMVELKLQASLVALNLISGLLPTLNVLGDELNEAAEKSDGFKGAMHDLAEAVIAIVNQLDNLVLVARLVYNAFKAVIQQTALLKLGMFEQAGQIGKEFEEYADGILMQYDRVARAAEKAKTQLPKGHDANVYKSMKSDDDFMSGKTASLEAAARGLVIGDAAAKEAEKALEKFLSIMADLQKATSTAQMNITEDERAKADMRIAIAMAEMAAKVDFAKLTAEQKMAYVQAFTDFSIAKTAEEMQKLSDTMLRLAEQAAASLAPALDMNQQLSDSARGIAEAYGAVGQSIGGMATSLAAYGETQKKIQEDAKKALKDNPQKAEAIAIAASNKQMISQVRLYGDLAGAAKGFFKEKSTGYKVMEAAEKAFRAIEFALSVKAMIQDNMETISFVANAMKVALAAGIAGVANAFKQMGVWGFVGAAAIIAFLAAIGVKMGGGGGNTKLPSAEQRQAEAGTGSVFGDASAKSESIANSLKILEENSFTDLEYTNAMLEALRAIQNNIEGLVNITVRRLGLPGGPGDTSKLGLGTTTTSLFPSVSSNVAINQLLSAGMWGLLATKVSRKLVDYGVLIISQTIKEIIEKGLQAFQYQTIEETTKKFLGLSKKTKISEIVEPLDDEFTRQFAMIILGIRDSVITAGEVLGIFGNDLSDFVVDIGHISLAGMTGEEIQAQFEAIFSKLGDDMAKAIFPAVTEFAKIGEGAMETLTRLARDYQIVDLALKSIGQTFALVGLASIEARERLIELSGGIDDFIEQAQAFAQTYLTDAERAAPVLNSVLAELSRLGIAGVYTLDAFKALVLSLDLTTEEGAALYAALMKLAPAFAAAVNAVHDAVQDYFDLILEAQQFQFDMQQKIIALGGGAGGGAGALVAMGTTLIEQYRNVTTTLEDKLAILGKLSGLVGAWVQQRAAEIAAQKSAATEAANARLEILNQELKLAREWVSVLSSAKQMLDQMKYTATNPLPTSGRLNLASIEVARLQQQLAGASPEDRAELSKKLLDALQKQLTLSQEFYQRPSPEYQAIYNDIIRQVTAIEAAAQENADKAERIQLEISALQEATVEQLKSIDAQMEAVNAQAADWYAQIAAEGALVYEELRKQAEQDILALADAAGQREAIIDILAEINAKLGVPAPGFAEGLSYVPYDNFAARLHQGERVLTAQESREYGSVSMPVTITINGGSKSDADAIAAAVDKRIKQTLPYVKQQLKRA